MNQVDARVAVQQRVLPMYRAPFFNMLGSACTGGLEVFAGMPRTREAIATVGELSTARFVRARNLHLFSGKTYFCVQRGILRWLEHLQPQVLIVEANPRYLSTPSAIQWMHRRHHPVIGWGLGAAPSGRAETRLRREFLHQLDAVIAYSQTGAEQYKAAGLPPERVFVACNAVAPRPDTPPLQRPLEFTDGRPTILFVGRLQERKKIDVLLRACALLPLTLQPHVIIVGDGPDRSRLETLSREAYPSVQFTGTKHNNELEPYFAAADLFVLPGTGGLAVQQAMAHALPVLVGESDGTQAELVRPTNGWILPAGSVDALAKQLIYALQDVPLLRKMGGESYRIVSEEINVESMVEAFIRAINSVL